MEKRVIRELIVRVEQHQQLLLLVLREGVGEEILIQEADLEAHRVKEEVDHRVDTKDVHPLTLKNLVQGQEAPLTQRERESLLNDTDHLAVGADHQVRRKEAEIIVAGAQLSVVGDHREQIRPKRSDNIVAVEATQRASSPITSEFQTWKREELRRQPTTSSLLDLND